MELTDALKTICVFYLYIPEINYNVCSRKYASHNQRLPLLLEAHPQLIETKLTGLKV